MTKNNYKRLGDYIKKVNMRNTDNLDIPLMGLSIQKCFIPSIANTIGTNMTRYKIIERDQFAYGPVTSRNGDKITIALFDDYDKALISQAYIPFKIKDKKELLPKYLMMWFSRPEFDRYARFKSHGSARETFDWDEMCDVELPIPSIEKQRQIVADYQAVENKIKTNEAICEKLEETAQTIYRRWFEEEGEKIRLAEMVSTQYGYTQSASEEKIGPKFLRITDIAKEFIEWSSVPFCEISESNLDKYKLHFGDIIVARTGATAGYGKRIHKQFPESVFASFLVRLIPNDIKWNYFLGLTVDSKEFREFILTNAQGSAQPQANANLLTSYEINRPDEKLILEFNEIMEPIFDFIENKRINNEKLHQLQSLLLGRMTRAEKRTQNI